MNSGLRSNPGLGNVLDKSFRSGSGPGSASGSHHYPVDDDDDDDVEDYY